MARATQAPCVILAAAGFAALPDHPSAIHVRLRAPLEWRIAAYQRDNVVDRRCAEKAVKHDDHVKRVWVRTLYGVDVDDARQFSLVLDASRFSAARIVETMLAAAGIGRAAGQSCRRSRGRRSRAARCPSAGGRPSRSSARGCGPSSHRARRPRCRSRRRGVRRRS
jgi:Cytidylate kinase-like family